MKKVLIVASDKTLAKTLKLVCNSIKLETIIANHDEALSIFLTEEPEAVLICDYQEGSNDFKAEETFKDIKNSSTNEIVLRCGFSNYDYSDYLRLPFELDEFKKKLKGAK